MSMRNILPILLASDINVYSMARAFHEAYGLRSLVLTKQMAGPIDHSRILDAVVIPDFDTTDVFLTALNKVYEQHRDKTRILIGCADHYVRLIVENKAGLAEKFILPYADKSVLDKIILKENFYRLCDTYGLDYARTYIYKQGTPLDFALDLQFPVVLKPSDSVSYNRCVFPGQYKVYFIRDRKTLEETLSRIYRHGYRDNMIIQEEVPGHDSAMYDLHVYTGKDHKVKLMSMGNVLLEEHTPKGLGSNAAALVSCQEPIMQKVRHLLEDIKFEGLCDCDLKFDSRDGKIKIFEINIRQGRSHYRVTAAGDNLAAYLVNDYILNKPLAFKMARDDFFWHVIPRRLVYRYIGDEEKKAKIRELVKAGKSARSLYYKKDLNLKRRLFLFLRDLNQFRKYKRHFTDRYRQ
ncbi:MAG TPA: ATP-grasp domain-containing protein [Clostridiaceae bacterium]|nr:ATP-grasp domain-containing protein [Clostridiaceae bacterium]